MLRLEHGGIRLVFGWYSVETGEIQYTKHPHTHPPRHRYPPTTPTLKYHPPPQPSNITHHPNPEISKHEFGQNKKILNVLLWTMTTIWIVTKKYKINISTGKRELLQPKNIDLPNNQMTILFSAVRHGDRMWTKRFTELATSIIPDKKMCLCVSMTPGSVCNFVESENNILEHQWNPTSKDLDWSQLHYQSYSKYETYFYQNYNEPLAT